jgi:hypothetical protein
MEHTLRPRGRPRVGAVPRSPLHRRFLPVPGVPTRPWLLAPMILWCMESRLRLGMEVPAQVAPERLHRRVPQRHPEMRGRRARARTVWAMARHPSRASVHAHI